MSEEVKLNFQDWNIKQIERSRDRMKLQIKLSKVEAESFKNFMDVVKPDEISEDDFLKGVFKIGVEEMETRLVDAVKKHAEENDIDLEKMAEEMEQMPEGGIELEVPVVGEVSQLKSPDEKNDEVQAD
mgnify:FL=1|tara:strand:+ start:677 stop:1060 length:384 start_codon:yes stop_codon:yes gene_type:complete